MIRSALALLLALSGTAQAGDHPEVSYVDRAGANHAPADLVGKVVLLHVWATWCGPCRTELPRLDALQAETRDRGLEVAAVSVDRLGFAAVDRLEAARQARALIFYSDPNRDILTPLRVLGLPTTLVLDRDGREIDRIAGPADWTSPEVRSRVDGWLAAASTGR